MYSQQPWDYFDNHPLPARFESCGVRSRGLMRRLAVAIWYGPKATQTGDVLTLAHIRSNRSRIKPLLVGFACGRLVRRAMAVLEGVLRWTDVGVCAAAGAWTHRARPPSAAISYQSTSTLSMVRIVRWQVLRLAMRHLGPNGQDRNRRGD